MDDGAPASTLPSDIATSPTPGARTERAMDSFRPVRLLTLATALLLAPCTPADDGGSAPSAGAPGAAGTPASVEAADVTPEALAAAISGEDIAAHVRTLSHDTMAGRAPGTAGGRMAADYIAAAFERAGLEPVEGSYFQDVPMVGSTPVPASAELVLQLSGDRLEPDYLDDFVLWAGDAEATTSVAEGELIFVGYGIEAPEASWSDYGADVEGKIVLILVNDPPAPADEPELFGGPAMTYYGRWTYKYEEAARQGAAGALIVHTTDAAGYGWNVVRGSWSGEQFSLPSDPDAPTPLAVEGWVTADLAEEALAAAGHDLGALMERAASRDFEPVATGITVRAAVESRVRRVGTRNVVGLLRGDERPDEVITVTSHYDHLGVGEPVEGDSIYNGAYDNASGTGVLIELAAALASRDDSPARSILFVATAAEEQGLLGAEWYVQNPLFPLERTVAEINVDGGNLWGETDDMTAMGADRNDLGEVVERRAGEMGITLVPDAEPEKGFFFRSDHFPFARAGVPALYLEHGREYRGRPAGWGDSILADYQAGKYHAPADEWSDDFTFEGSVQQATLAGLVILDLADSAAWPGWNADSEFRAAREAMKGRPGG